MAGEHPPPRLVEHDVALSSLLSALLAEVPETIDDGPPDNRAAVQSRHPALKADPSPPLHEQQTVAMDRPIWAGQAFRVLIFGIGGYRFALPLIRLCSVGAVTRRPCPSARTAVLAPRCRPSARWPGDDGRPGAVGRHRGTLHCGALSAGHRRRESGVGMRPHRRRHVDRLWAGTLAAWRDASGLAGWHVERDPVCATGRRCARSVDSARLVQIISTNAAGVDVLTSHPLCLRRLNDEQYRSGNHGR